MFDIFLCIDGFSKIKLKYVIYKKNFDLLLHTILFIFPIRGPIQLNI